MSTRSEGLQWLRSHYGAVDGLVRTSKFFEAKESWSGTCVWWFQVPVEYVKEGRQGFVHLLGKMPYNSGGYCYLKVPVSYFCDQFTRLGFTNEDMINLHLSAEPHNLFEDERGKGKVPFSQFLVAYNATGQG